MRTTSKIRMPTSSQAMRLAIRKAISKGGIVLQFPLIIGPAFPARAPHECSVVCIGVLGKHILLHVPHTQPS